MALAALCAAALALLPGLAGAAGCTITWTGAAGDGLWSSRTNWVNAAGAPAVPNKSDDVCITAGGTYTVTLEGALSGSATVNSLTLGAGANSGTQTLIVDANVVGAAAAAGLTLIANSTVAVGGELELDGGAGGSTATLSTLTGASLTNDGQLLLASAATGEDLLRANVVNAAKATTEISTSNATQDQATTTTNDGTFTVDKGAALNLTNASGSFSNAGSVSNAGSLTLTGDASWTQNGPESGNPVTIFNSGTLTDTSGAGSFTLTDTPTLTGTIAAGQTVTLSAPSGHGATATLSGNVTNDGNLNLDAPANGGAPVITGGTLTNSGTITATSESTNVNSLNTTLNNGGTLEVKTGTLLQSAATATTNTGTLKVDTGATFNPDNAGAKVINNATAPGGVVNNGTLSLTSDASWTQNGPESGNTVTIFNSGTLTDTSGAGSFTLTDTPILIGTIPAGQTVTASAPSGHGATVSLNGGTLINDGTLNLDAPAGGGAPIIDNGTITNAGAIATTSESTNVNSLNATLNNSGTLEVKTGTLTQSAATTTTNTGTLKVDTGATFNPDNAGAKVINNATAPGGVVNSGTLSLTGDASWTQNGPESGNTVTIFNSGTLTDTSGAGSFTLTDTPILIGTIPAGQTVTASAPSGHGATVSLNGNVTNNGNLDLDAPKNGGTPGIAPLSGTPLLTNNGRITTTSESGNPNDLSVTLTNSATGTVEVKSGMLQQDAATITTNVGTFQTDAPGAGAFDPNNAGARFVNDGTLSNAGSVTLSGDASWTQNAHAAAQSGNPVTILNSGTLSDTSGAGSFTLTDTPTLTGTIPSGQTVTVSAPSGHGATVSLSGGTLINDGSLNLDAPAGGGAPVIDNGTITNAGAIATTSESTNVNALQATLNNSGTLEVKTGTLLQNAATTTTNTGTLKVDTGATFNPSNASAKVINNATAPGGVVNNGTLSLTGDASWTQNGPESGNTVTIFNSGTLTDTSGAGSFTLTDTPILTGTIPAGQTVTARAPQGHGATVSLNGGTLINDGSLNLDAPASGGAPVVDNGTITNPGTITATSESTNSNALQVTLNNSGTLEVKTGTLAQNAATTTTNTGTLLVDPGAVYSPNNAGAHLVNATAGTLEFEIASATSYGTIALAGGATLQPGGTVDPVLLAGYNPPAGTEFDVITGADPGAFPTVTNNFGGDSSHAAFFGVIRLDAATVAVTLSGPSIAPGQSETITATVSGPAGVTPGPSGTVTFTDNGTPIGMAPLVTTGSTGTATLTVPNLSTGTHAIGALYGGDGRFATASAPTPATVSVQPTTTTTTTTTSATTTTATSPPTTTATGSGSVSAASTSVTASSSTTTHVPPPPPVLYKSVNVVPVSGKVFIKLPPGATLSRAAGNDAFASATKGQGFIPLTEARQIPVGSELDTTAGTVAITAASTTRGRFFTTDVTAGIFSLLQSRKEKGITEFDLHDTQTANRVCATAGKRKGAFLARKLSNAVLGLLKSSDHGGKFSTRGSYSAATTRGTQYSVEDTCAGTLTTVTRGTVVVDYFRRHRNVVVSAGHAFLAKASGRPSSVFSLGKAKG